MFLVERYLPLVGLDDLAAVVASVARACDEQRNAGARLRYLHSTYIPDDETCFCAFEAASAHDVNLLNADMDFRIDRISRAASFDTGLYSSSTTRQEFIANPRKRLP